jgi:lincosamide nucleotidyltransferase A/C/D/E
MEASEVVRLLELFERAGIAAWVDGGWGVDALLEAQTREHDDLDLVIELRHAARAAAVLEDAGYAPVAGGAPKSFVHVTADGRQIDVHPVTFAADGSGVYVMDSGAAWAYPAQGFSGRGRVLGREARCLSPEVQVLVHAGYELGEKDYRELWLLHQRFGVELPADKRERAAASAAY